jgi:single-strand DNA-binding protein
MANYNRVILIGNLTRDPQMSYLPSQTAVVDFGLAVNRRWKGKDGQQSEETCFVDCRCFGKSAETLNQYVKKGAPILVEGRLHFDQWDGKDGTKHSKHRVVVENFQFIGGKPQGSAPIQESAPGAAKPPITPAEDPAPVEPSSDIPF